MQNITLYFENMIYEIWNSRLHDNPLFYANLKYSLYITTDDVPRLKLTATTCSG